LPDGMFYKVDRSSMATSLEVRVPYLDNDVVDYALSLPLKLKSTNRFTQKAPLKNLLEKLAPHYNLNLPKKGFNLPINNWMHTFWKEQIINSFNKNDLINLGLDYTYCKELISNFHKNKSNDTEVWYYFNLLLWYRSSKEKIEA
jgi:asparagine synthase (glutamine-hydrolysing)